MHNNKKYNSFCSLSLFLLELFQYPWMVYHKKLKTSGVVLFDTTMVSPLTLVFFGRKLIQNNEIINGQEISCVEVDSIVKFNCENETQIGKKHALKNMTSSLKILAAFEEVPDLILPQLCNFTNFLLQNKNNE